MWFPTSAPIAVTTLLVLLNLSTSISAAGWYMDKSCLPYQDLILPGMQEAFDLVDKSLALLRSARPPQNLPTQTKQQKLMEQAEWNLLNYMFKETIENGQVNVNGHAFQEILYTLNAIRPFNRYRGTIASYVERKRIPELKAKLLANSNKEEKGDPNDPKVWGKYLGPPAAPLPPGVQEAPQSVWKDTSNIILYCDYEHWGEFGVDCLGQPLDPLQYPNPKQTACHKHWYQNAEHDADQRNCKNPSLTSDIYVRPDRPIVFPSCTYLC